MVGKSYGAVPFLHTTFCGSTVSDVYFYFVCILRKGGCIVYLRKDMNFVEVLY